MLSIYLPIFVDTMFSTKAKATWLPIVSLCGPLGSCIGYSITGTLTSMGHNWTVSFFLLAVSMAVCLVIWILIPSSYTNLDEVEHFLAFKKEEELNQSENNP